VSSGSIEAIRPPGSRGHQFVVYGDSCSGVPGAIHEATTATVNDVVARLRPAPEFVCFLGDEIIGLTTDEEALRAQWEHWFDHEMAWLDNEIPMYHVPANHTTYDKMSEAVYTEVMSHLPANGPMSQKYLSYFVLRGDLLMIFVNTNWTGLGEGRVETDWLNLVLFEHRHVPIKLVFGHHPVFPVNGFVGAFQRELEPSNGREFQDLLVRYGVRAYFCSHMLAFDVQVHEGVLQVMTAGAGTKHRMPEESEYLHAVQVALDGDKLRYQVLDVTGERRESLAWPLPEPSDGEWGPVSLENLSSSVRIWDIQGIVLPSRNDAQTFVSGWNDVGLPAFWFGLIGPELRLSVLLAPQPGRSPHLWFGPTVPAGESIGFQVMLHPGMRPGGLLWRWSADEPWSSLNGASAWGLERLPPIANVSIGHASASVEDRPFLGSYLNIREQILEEL
jgi:hypothetical protein